MIIFVLLQGQSGWAAVSSAQPKNCSSAFADEITRSPAEEFLSNGRERWQDLGRIHLARTIAKEALQELAKIRGMDQAGKVLFWRRVVYEIQNHYRLSFVSVEFAGSDGSIFFQGGELGAVMVICPRGDVYLGSALARLNYDENPRPVWSADYSRLTQVNKAEN